MSAFTDFEERFYTCSICMSPYEDPKSLPCLHTFCEGCLRDYTETRGFASHGSFPCPQCRNETTIPHGGVAKFPSNFQLMEFVEHIRGRVAADPATAATALAVAPAPSLYPSLVGQATQAPSMLPAQQMPPPPPPHPAAAAAAAAVTQPAHTPPVQRHLHINPADHVVPVQQNVKNALVVFGQYGNSLTDFTTPISIANFANKYLVVSDQRFNRVMVFGLEGQIQSMFTCHGQIQGIACDPRGHVLLANSKLGRALAKSFSLQGQTQVSIGTQFTHEKPHGIAATNTNIAVSSLETNKVFIFDPSGRLVREIGGTGSRKMQLRAPYYLAFNSKNDVIVSDSGNHAIKVFAAGSGQHKLSIGGEKSCREGELHSPLGIAVDCDDNIVVCDAGNHRVQVYNARGKFLGVVAKEIYGEGGEASSVVPRDVAVFDAPGKLAVLVAGSDTCQVRIYPYSAKNKDQCLCS